MPDKNGEVLKFEEGKFLQAIKENKWLIIDEINRADIDKAFGQLFTVLSGQGVELPYKINNKSIKIERTNDNKSYFDSETATYKVGNNWRILATMNVFDKDYLFEMSYAFMRRFTFIYVDLPLHEELTDLISEVWGTDLNDNYINSIVNLMKINEHRPIGPAIFKDMVEYVAEREKIKDPTENSSEVIIEDAIISFILPQFEGLELQKLKKIWKNVLIHYNHNNHLKSRLEDISGITFTNKLSEDNDESN
jgi:MoxR-like ATPase